MMPSLMAYCTFIRPPTLSASASSVVWRFSSAMISAREVLRRQRAGAVAGVDAGFLDVLHDAADEDVLAVAEAVDVDLDGAAQVAVEQQRVVGEDRVDLAGLVVGVAHAGYRAAPAPVSVSWT